MKVDVYMAERAVRPREHFYAMVPSGSGTDILPEDVRRKLGRLDFFKRIDIKKGEKRIALDLDKALKELEPNGFYVQGTKIEIVAHA